MSVDEIIERVLSMPVEDRRRVRDAVDETLEEDVELSPAWTAEIERRYHDFVENGRRGIPLADAMAELRARRTAG